MYFSEPWNFQGISKEFNFIFFLWPATHKVFIMLRAKCPIYRPTPREANANQINPDKVAKGQSLRFQCKKYILKISHYVEILHSFWIFGSRNGIWHAVMIKKRNSQKFQISSHIILHGIRKLLNSAFNLDMSIFITNVIYQINYWLAYTLCLHNNIPNMIFI